MTNTRTNRKRIGAILGAALLFVLLTGFVLAFSMSAVSDGNSTVAFTVGGKNIDLGDELRIVYKVDLLEGYEELDARMYFWLSAPTSYDVRTASMVSKPLTESEQAEINAADADYVFISPKITQAEMTKYIYGVVYAEKDGVTYTSEPVRYSVLDYVYQRRAEHLEGIKTASPDQLALYSATLRAGEATQEFLNVNTDRLANAKYATVKVEGGTLPDGFTTGLYTGGETVTFVASATDSIGRPFVKWVDAKGNTLSKEMTAEVTMAKVTAGYPDATPTVTYTAVYGLSEDVGEPTNVDGTLVHVIPSQNSTIDPVKDANKYGTENTVLVFEKNMSGAGTNLKAVVSDNTNDTVGADTVYVFEGSFHIADCVNGTSGNNIAMNIALGNTYRMELSFAKNTTEGTNTMMLWDINYDGGRNFLGELTYDADSDTVDWLDLKVEFYKSLNLAKIYINDTLVSISKNAYYSLQDTVENNATTYTELFISVNESSIQETYVHGLKSYFKNGTYTDADFDGEIREPSRESTAFSDRWVVVENTLTEKSVAALKSLYNFYDDPTYDGDDIWRWVAELWDAEIGAFYYATSGKYTEGYLPDTEATSQSLGYLASSGIFSAYGNDAKRALDAISEYMYEEYGFEVNLRSKVAAFAYSRLASDGLTRHPQWSQTLSESDARIGRDHSNSSGLREYGSIEEDVIVLDNPTASAVSYMMSGAAYMTIPLGASYNVLATADEAAEGTLPADLAVLTEYVLANYQNIPNTKLSLAKALGGVDTFIQYLNYKSRMMTMGAPGTNGYLASHGYGHGMSSSFSIIKKAGALKLVIDDKTYTVELKDLYAAYMNTWRVNLAKEAYETGREITGLWELEYFNADRDDKVYTDDPALVGTTGEFDGITFTYVSDIAEFYEDTKDGGNRQYYTELSGLYKIGSSYSSAGHEFENIKLSEIITDPVELAAYKAKFNIPEYGFERDENGNPLEYGLVDAMIDRCIDGILGNADPEQFVHIYNPWLALNTMYSSLRKVNKNAEYEVYDMDAIIDYVRGENDIVDGKNRTERMVEITINKITPYRCADGTFSYFKQYSDPATQGTPVGVGAKEGDINATSLASNGMRGAIFTVLGLTRPALFDGVAHFEAFRDEIVAEELAAAGISGTTDIKKPLETKVQFEYEESAGNFVVNNYFVEGNVTLEQKDAHDYYVSLNDSDANAGKSATFNLTAKLHNTNSEGITPHVVDYNNIGYAMFRADFYIDWADNQPNNNGFQIFLGSSSAQLYMLTLEKTSAGKIAIGDGHGTSKYHNELKFGGSQLVINDGQWFTVLVEYYTTGSGYVKVTVTEANGTKHVGTSTQLFDNAKKTDLKLQSGSNKMLSILARAANVTDLLIDNLSYGYGSVPKVETAGGATHNGGAALEYGQKITLRAPATDANGAAFAGFKRNTGILSTFNENLIKQTSDPEVADATLPGLESWFNKTGVQLGMGKLVGDYYELEVLVPAGETTFTALYDTRCEVEFENVVNNSETAPTDGKYHAGENTFSAPLKNADGEIFDHWELDGTLISYAATVTVDLPVGGKVTLTAVYKEKTVNIEDFVVSKPVDKETHHLGVTEDETGHNMGDVLVHDATGNTAPIGGGTVPVDNKFQTTAAAVKVFGFDMYMPKLTDASVYTDYFNEATSFAGLYQITISMGGKAITMLHASAPNSGSIDGYFLGIADNTNYTHSFTADDVLLAFDQWYHVTVEMVFAADENGDYTIPSAVNLYVNDRFVGTTSYFFCAKENYDQDGNPTDGPTVYYDEVCEGDLTITRFFSPMRSKAKGYFDNLFYYENTEATE